MKKGSALVIKDSKNLSYGHSGTIQDIQKFNNTFITAAADKSFRIWNRGSLPERMIQIRYQEAQKKKDDVVATSQSIPIEF